MTRWLWCTLVALAGCTKPHPPAPGACFSQPSIGTTCEETSREDCPIEDDGSRAFFGEGTECPNSDTLYAWDGTEECEVNVSGDEAGVIDIDDLGIVLTCLGQQDTDCAGADIDHNGRVDAWDVCIVFCGIEGTTGNCCENPGCGACLSDSPVFCEVSPDCEVPQYVDDLALCPDCACDGDVNGDARADDDDASVLSDCADGTSGAACAKADIDCDGSVTACDESALACILDGERDCCLRICSPP